MTLIEVMIALAIIAIALTAVIKATSQNIRDTTYVQQKIIANWVGLQVINQARVGLISLPDFPEQLKQQTKMLGRTWNWAAAVKSTPNMHIQEIDVDVSGMDDTKLVTLVSYVYHAQ